MRGIVFLAGLVVLPCGVARGGFVIDSFSDVAAPDPWPISTTVPNVIPVLEENLSGVVGGTRLTTLTALFFDQVGIDQVQAQVLPGLGVLDYTSSVGADGDLQLAYVGVFDADLSGDQLIQIDFTGFNRGTGRRMSVVVTLGDGATTARDRQRLVQNGPQSLIFNLSEFQNINGVDLSSINSIVFDFDPGPGGDFRIGGITSVVPEPATLVILLAGAAAVFRRRRTS